MANECIILLNVRIASLHESTIARILCTLHVYIQTMAWCKLQRSPPITDSQGTKNFVKRGRIVKKYTKGSLQCTDHCWARTGFCAYPNHQPKMRYFRQYLISSYKILILILMISSHSYNPFIRRCHDIQSYVVSGLLPALTFTIWFHAFMSPPPLRSGLYLRFCLYDSLHICLSICQSVYLSYCPGSELSIFLSVYLSN